VVTLTHVHVRHMYMVRFFYNNCVFGYWHLAGWRLNIGYVALHVGTDTRVSSAWPAN
jgi:hypothetical protein